MRKIVITKGLVVIAFIMLILPSMSASAIPRLETEVKTIASGTAIAPKIEKAETVGELTLQEWFDANGYAINVTEDELEIETFEAGYCQITILAEIAGYAPSNNLSWYPASSSDLHLIFSEVNSTGDTIVFKATETFGLCLGTPDGVLYNETTFQLFYTETNRNLDEFDHALVFVNPNLPGGYIIVWEDLWEGGDMDFQDMILAVTPVIEAQVCICPFTLNLKSRGKWITGFIKLPRNYHVEDIDVSTITLNGTIPAEPKPIAIFDFDCVGFKVLMVKFNRMAAIEYVKNAIVIDGNTSKWVKITLTVSGNLFNGQAFEGSTKIRIIHFPRCITCEASVLQTKA
ncbi:MAG: DUF4114 domain-containing protein [Candidatus Bathyarchaeota archaeon]|nr:DUF4114 domain-containing protein [Candidatus Bathyarchaeota archaeon]MDH5494860.1 DUF4114 domain-containing protein [Candidatus Bathyarchaeota archaeon]